MSSSNQNKKVPTLTLLVVTTVIAAAVLFSATHHTQLLHAPEDDDHRQLGLLKKFNDPKSTSTRLGQTNDIASSSFYVEAIDMTLKLPNDPEYINKVEFKKDPRRVKYLRNMADIAARGTRGKCMNAVDVLGWIMDEVNEQRGTLMIAYGSLIHLYREKDFVQEETGEYIDDDFDMFGTVDTASVVAKLEPELFKQFGWTARAFYDPKLEYVVFMQIIASCGHTPVERPTKVRSDEPGIDVYLLAPSSSPEDGGSPGVVKDLWQATSFAESMIFPPRYISFDSTRTRESDVLFSTRRPLLYLQVPNKPFEFLSCMYGDWMTPSSEHAPDSASCLELDTRES